MDLRMPRCDGVTATRQIRAEHPRTQIVVLTTFAENAEMLAALRAGARGYLQKHEAIDGLIQAIRHVISGKVFVSDTVAQQVLAGLRGTSPSPTDQLATITDREIQVLERVGRGSSTAEIARDLGVSVKTIETYRSNIKAKLNLKSALDLVRYATSWIERP